MFMTTLLDGMRLVLRGKSTPTVPTGCHRVFAAGAPAKAANVAQHGMPRIPEELRKHRLIGHLRGDGNRPAEWQFRYDDGTRSLRLPMALSFNTVDALTVSALEGQGMVQQLDLLVSSYLSEGRLVEVLREYSCEGPPLSVIYPKATQHLAKVRVFAEFAGDLMRNYEARMRRKAEPASR